MIVRQPGRETRHFRIEMSLQGKAALVMWHGVESSAREAHDDWHSHEHLMERLALPGFRRGRRCVSPDGERYFLMYEVDELETLTSAAYQARLNDPSDWSKQVIPSIRDMNRTLCRTLVSFGLGVGGWVGTRRFSVEPGGRQGLLDHFVRLGAEGMAARPGVTGIHALEGDKTASALRTEEKNLRSTEDETADLALVVEGYDRERVLKALNEELGREALATRGGVEIGEVGLYQTVHVVTEQDV